MIKSLVVIQTVLLIAIWYVLSNVLWFVVSILKGLGN